MRLAIINCLASVLVLLTGACCRPAAVQAETVGFDDLPLAEESHWNGSDESGGFSSGGTFFKNTYDTYYGSWDGWAYSNTTDTTTPGYMNQFSAYAGGGAAGSSNYGVAFDAAGGGFQIDRVPTASFNPQTGYRNGVAGAYFTNTTYAVLSMQQGDDFAKKFGGESGDDPDWYKLEITATDSLGGAKSMEFYLADYRFANNEQDYIIEDWTWVDLSPLNPDGGVDLDSLEFTVSSSDVDPEWGMNTPAYFAMDNLTAVPEPSATGMLLGVATFGFVGWARRRVRVAAKGGPTKRR